jgi:hypothetical protein
MTMKKFVRSLLLGALDLAELLVSAAVHLSYGFYIFAAAVGRDLLSRALVEGRNSDATGSNDAGDDEDAVLDGEVPPIVLVHGVFGFGKGVRNALPDLSRILPSSC